MTESKLQDDEISLFALGTTLLRNRWRIVRWMVIGAVVATLFVVAKPALYRGSASFVPQSDNAGHSGLASIAGQFGVTLPSASETLSPEFYTKLLTSRVLLQPIVRDTFTIPELGGRRVSFLKLFKVRGESPQQQEEQGVKLLKKMVIVLPDKTTEILEFSVETKWRSVSLAIITALLNGVNDYNAHTKQEQAAAERRFLEGRLATASADLRAAEDHLEEFLRANRNIENSPELTLERDRLQRTVGFGEQIFTSLTQSYDETRMRELRDTPVITIFEPPVVPMLPESREALKHIFLGLLLGGVIGIFLAFASGMIERNHAAGNPEADEFLRTLREMRWWGSGSVWPLRGRTEQ